MPFITTLIIQLLLSLVALIYIFIPPRITCLRPLLTRSTSLSGKIIFSNAEVVLLQTI